MVKEIYLDVTLPILKINKKLISCPFLLPVFWFLSRNGTQRDGLRDLRKLKPAYIC